MSMRVNVYDSANETGTDMDDLQAVVNLKGVSVCRDENLLIRGLSLSVLPGDFVYITGPVGAGKSSLLKTLYAEMPVVEGEAQVVGFDLRHLPRRRLPVLRRRIGIIFQDFQLLYNLTVEGNLDFVLRAIGIKKKSDRVKRIEEVLTHVGMTRKGYKRPHELSGGEQQRVAIARALLGHPKLILADEPTGNLDAGTGLEITRLLHRTAREEQTAVLMVTHNERVLNELPARVLRINIEPGKTKEGNSNDE